MEIERLNWTRNMIPLDIPARSSLSFSFSCLTWIDLADNKSDLPSKFQIRKWTETVLRLRKIRIYLRYRMLDARCVSKWIHFRSIQISLRYKTTIVQEEILQLLIVKVKSICNFYRLVFQDLFLFDCSYISS